MDSCFFKNASTLPQFRQMTLELLQNNVEVIDVFPIFMQHKYDSMNLFAKGHHISSYGANLVAQAIADYIQSTTHFETGDKHFSSQKTIVDSVEKTTIYQGEGIYIPQPTNSSFAIFGNCNLQAYHEEGTGIAANLSFYLNKDVDYLGRKLIFCNLKNETFDEQTFKECCKKDIVICISFLSGSFVRTSVVGDKKMKQYLLRFLKGKNIHSTWSTFALGR